MPNLPRHAEVPCGREDRPGLLDDLDRIDWGILRHGRGAAGDVPGLLQCLTGQNVDMQQQAFDDLCDLLEHQGSLYSATVAAVPFLLRLVADPAFTQRRTLLEFLAFIAPGIDRDWWRAIQRDPEVLERHVDMVVERHRTDTMDVPGYRAIIRDEIVSRPQVYEAVRTGLPLYRDLLDDDDPRVRICALDLLTAFDEDYADSLPTVRARIDVEDRLRFFSDATPWCIALCERLLGTHPSPHVRLGAANTLVHLQLRAAPLEAMALLAHAYAERDEFAPGVQPLHISTPHDAYGGKLLTDAGIEGLTVDQIVPMTTIMIHGLAARTPQDNWRDYCRRVERICAFLFELPAMRQGADTRLDDVRRVIVVTAAPILISHITKGPQAWTASDNAELLLHLAYPYAAQLARIIAPQDIADLRSAALVALAHGDFWHHTFGSEYLSLVERVLATIAVHRDEQRRADVRAAERALLTAIVAAVRPDAPIRPQVEALVAHFASLLA